MRRAFSRVGVFALLACAASWAAAAGLAGQDRLRLGVYAYDVPAGVVWSCSSVVTAVEKLMSQALATDVQMTVHLDSNYKHGVADVLSGAVDLGRFPNVPSRWVVHPGTQPRLVAAWRAAVLSLDIETFLRGLRTRLGAEPVAQNGVPNPALVSAVESRFGVCSRLGMQAAATTPSSSPSPASTARLAGLDLALAEPGGEDPAAIRMITGLPPTAAGRRGHPAER